MKRKKKKNEQGLGSDKKVVGSDDYTLDQIGYQQT